MRLLKNLLVLSTVITVSGTRAQTQEDDPTGLIARRSSEAIAIGVGAGSAYHLKKDAQKWQEYRAWKANKPVQQAVEAELRRDIEAHVRMWETREGYKLPPAEFERTVNANLAERRTAKAQARATAIGAAKLRLADLDEHIQVSEEDFKRLANDPAARRTESIRLLREKPRAWTDKKTLAMEQGKIITKKDYLTRRSQILKYIAEHKATMPMLRPKVPFPKLLGVGLGLGGLGSLTFDLASRAKAYDDEMKELEEQVEEAKRAHDRGEYDDLENGGRFLE